jgi:predicted LPLAT superfamily acyltransferase
MKSLKIISLVGVLIFISYIAYDNYKLNKKLSSFQQYIEYNAALSSDNAMKLEMFLQAMSSEFDSEVRRVAKPIAREEAIKVLKEFADNFKKLSEE